MQDTGGSVGKFSLEHGKKTSKDDNEVLSEDDTYKKLSRISFDEMLRIFKEWKGPVNETKDIEVFLNLHKWTYAEYLYEITKKHEFY